MGKGDSLADTERVLRRFDPTDLNHVTHDDAGKPVKLRSSALRWDVPTEEPFNRKECSVYWHEKLTQNSMTPASCIEKNNPNWSVASASVGKIRTLKRANVPDENPFDVIEDPLSPDRENAHARDIAHSSIKFDTPQTGADKWCREVAMQFIPLSEVDLAALSVGDVQVEGSPSSETDAPASDATKSSDPATSVTVNTASVDVVQITSEPTSL